MNRIAENMLIEAKKSLSEQPATEENEHPSLTPIEPTNTLLKLSYFKYLANSLADVSPLTFFFNCWHYGC
jgi:hypothetical protein